MHSHPVHCGTAIPRCAQDRGDVSGCEPPPSKRPAQRQRAARFPSPRPPPASRERARGGGSGSGPTRREYGIIASKTRSTQQQLMRSRHWNHARRVRRAGSAADQDGICEIRSIRPMTHESIQSNGVDISERLMNERPEIRYSRAVSPRRVVYRNNSHWSIANRARPREPNGAVISVLG